MNHLQKSTSEQHSQSLQEKQIYFYSNRSQHSIQNLTESKPNIDLQMRKTSTIIYLNINLQKSHNIQSSKYHNRTESHNNKYCNHYTIAQSIKQQSKARNKNKNVRNKNKICWKLGLEDLTLWGTVRSRHASIATGRDCLLE